MDRRWRQVGNRFFEFGQLFPIFRIIGPFRGGGMLTEIRTVWNTESRVRVYYGFVVVGSDAETLGNWNAGANVIQRPGHTDIMGVGPLMRLVGSREEFVCELRLPLAIRVPTGAWYVLMTVSSSAPENHDVTVSVIVEGGTDLVEVVAGAARHK